MFKRSKLSFKLSASIIILILFVETALLFISYEKKCDQLLEMQQYEKSLYGKNLIYTKSFIDNYLQNYSFNIILLSLLISAIVSIGFILIYHRFVGKYLTKISKLNNEKSPFKTKKAFRKIPDDEIGDVIKSRIEMLTRIEIEISTNKKLLRILSHDLANLLMINYGSISALKKLLVTEDEKVIKNLDRIQFASDRQKELIEKVRNFDASKDKLNAAEIKEYNLADLLNESLTVFEDRLNAKGINVRLENFSDENSYIHVDRVLFSNNVLNNIISNAIKFSEDNSEILVIINEDDKGTTLKIRDRGIGIPEDMLKNIFDGGVDISRPGLNGEAGTGFGMGLLKSTLDVFNCIVEVKSHEKESNETEHGTEIIINFLNKIKKEAA